MHNETRNYVIVILMAMLLGVAMVVLLQKQQTPEPPMAEVLEDVAEAADNAADEVTPAETPSEKLGEAIEDAGEGINDAMNP